MNFAREVVEAGAHTLLTSEKMQLLRLRYLVIHQKLPQKALVLCQYLLDGRQVDLRQSKGAGIHARRGEEGRCRLLSEVHGAHALRHLARQDLSNYYGSLFGSLFFVPSISGPIQ